MPMPKFAWSLAPLAVLTFALWQAADTLGRTPAYNSALKVENVVGGTRSFREGSMYHRAEYLYQVGYGYRHASVNLLILGGLEAFKARVERSRAEGRGDVTTGEFARARDLALDSLRLRPGDAAAWLLLASAHEILGENDPARAALRRSRALAPYSNGLAAERLDLAATLWTKAGAPGALPLRDSARTDIETLALFDRGALARLEDRYPALAGDVEKPRR